MEAGQEDARTERSAQSEPLKKVAPDTANNGTQADTSPVPTAGRIDNDEGDSDISMSSDSDSDSDETDDGDAPGPTTEDTSDPAHDASRIQGKTSTASKKRKSPGADSQASGTGELPASESRKKARLDGDAENPSPSNGIVRDRSLLAPEVWHRIFTFCPPKTLGNLLSVNKLFHRYLNPSSPDQIDYPPSEPRGVLRLLESHDIWQSSRRLFWPRMPAPLRSMSELSMWRLLCSTKCQECSTSPSNHPVSPPDNVHDGPGTEGVTLIWPFGIRVCGPCLLDKAVKEIDVLLSSTVPSSLIPALPFVHITKDLHAVTLSTIEQGLLPSDVLVTKIFLASDVQEIKQEFISVKSLGSGTLEEWLKGLEPRGQARLNEYRKWEKWADTGALQHVRQLTDSYAIDGLTAPVKTAAMTVLKTTGDHPQAAAPTRRTVEEVAELKAARKAEIERRASLLNPPLTPQVLRHMVSFQAAIQLITALDDNAWDLLRRRLMAERSEAEEMEKRVSAQIRTIQGPGDRSSHLEATLATTKEAKDAIDRDWEEVQGPLRAKIVRYVDEFIRESWDKGKKVKQDNCSRFAAEALLHVRKRFYAQVAKAADAAKAAGKAPAVDTPEGPFLHKLTLENMRWVFDTKIKPLTAPFRKEVFFCNGCAAKPFGFEGVIQHYAAKHTDKLSSGNVVVHWRAEWPEEPPFNPEGRMKAVYPAPGVATPHPPSTVPPPAYPFPSYMAAPGPGVLPPGQPPAPGPSYGVPPYAEQYAHQYPGYPQNSSYVPPTSGLASQIYAQPPPGWPPYQTGPSPSLAVGYQAPISAAGAVSTPSAVPGQYNFGGYPGAVGGVSTPQSAPPYPVQLEDIVRNSREIWNATANIRDLPGSVRIFATIHHVVKRFSTRFSQTPALAIFQDGLSNHKDMRPVRNINGLACKACQLGLGNAPYIQKDRESFSLPQLVNHFQSKHIEDMLKDAPNSPPLDWVNDMIMLPPRDILAELPSSVGSDAFKYKLISEAFPEVFGLVPPPSTPSFYGQHPQQYATYTQPPQYGSSTFPSTTQNHEQLSAQHQDPHHSQGQHVTNEHSYQPQPDYAQVPSAHGYIPPVVQAPAYQPDPAHLNPAIASIAERDVPRREENSSRSSQSSRQRPQSGSKWTRKERKRHAQSSQLAQNKHSGRQDEEPKLTEEEKAREEELRAMWANDRAATARTLKPFEAQPTQDEPRAQQRQQKQPQPAAEESRAGLYQDTREAAPQRNVPSPKEEASLLDALEMHLDQGRQPPARSQPAARDQADAVYRGAPELRAAGASEVDRRPPEHGPRPVLSNRKAESPLVPHVDRARDDYTQQRARTPGQYAEYYPQEPAPPHPGLEEIRYEPRDQLPPAHYHEDPPVRRPDAHRRYDHVYRPEEQIVYERLPQDDRHRPSYPEALNPPPARGLPTGQLYEIVEVIDAHGSYFIRRPIGRAPPPEQVYYDYPPYEPERPRERQPPPIGAGRGDPEPYPLPRTANAGGGGGDEDNGYRRRTLHPQFAPPTQQQREEYPLAHPSSSAHMWETDYPPHQFQRPAAPSRPGLQPARGGFEEEEYDPRFPAGSPPGPGPGTAPSRTAPVRYQRRQVRYD